MDALVAATGVSRYGIYSQFENKHGLYLACFELYARTVVTPAFARVEARGAGPSDIRAYFDHQIEAAATLGLPGPGCFMANSGTETAPHDEAVRAIVEAHNARLAAGFQNALGPGVQAARLAQSLVVFATGLWSLSRLTTDSGQLKTCVATMMGQIERDLK